MAAVKWHGVIYESWRTVAPFGFGAPVSGGAIPGCDDTVVNGEVQHEPDTPTAVTRVKGIDPRVALARRPERRIIYIAPGFLPQLRSFPEHDALFGAHDQPAVKRCFGPLRTIVGRAPFKPTSALVIESGGSSSQIQLRRDTRYHGRHRLGLPFVGKGDRITVRGLHCIVAGDARAFIPRSLRVRRA